MQKGVLAEPAAEFQGLLFKTEEFPDCNSKASSPAPCTQLWAPEASLGVWGPVPLLPSPQSPLSFLGPWDLTAL